MAAKRRRLKIAVLGCGKMGSYHIDAIREIMAGKQEVYYKGGVGDYLSRLTLDSLVDPLFKTGHRDQFGTHCFPDPVSMLKSRRPDVAIIATPTATHFDIASLLLAEKIPLLIEKPVADTTARVRWLKKLAAEYDSYVLPGHIERYNPAAMEIFETLRHKVYGKPLSYSFVRTSPRPRRIPDSIIVDKLVHDIDLLIGYFGKPKIEDVNFSYDRKHTVTECCLHLRHPRGVCGKLFSSWRVSRKERSFTINTEAAEISGDFLKKRLHISRQSEYSKDIQTYANNQIRDQLADFIAGCFNLWPPLVSIDDAINSALVVDKVNRLAKMKK